MLLMERPLQPFLDSAGFVVLDGAMATELERRGADLRDPLWSAKVLVEQPELIEQVHYDYFLAGADVVTTASYQATFAGFARRGLDADEAAGLLRRSVEVAKKARDRFWKNPGHRSGRRWPLIAASIGPYGAFLADGSEFRGDYQLSRDQLIDFHRRRMQVLTDSGADLLACETIPCLVEAEALLALLCEFPEIPAWLSFSCRDEKHLCSGERLDDAVRRADRSGQVVAIGINCTSPRYIGGLLASIKDRTNKPLLVYPNRGGTWDPVERHWRDDSDSSVDWGKAARDWFAAGARLIGGCCRTTPDDILRVREALEARLKPR
jgi:homocysteine S-methyltransferase